MLILCTEPCKVVGQMCKSLKKQSRNGSDEDLIEYRPFLIANEKNSPLTTRRFCLNMEAVPQKEKLVESRTNQQKIC